MCGVASDTITVDSTCHTLLEMPNVFSPGNDGINDHFLPKKIQLVSNVDLIIYNCWGNKLIETNDIAKGWDGKSNGIDSPEGIYYWVVNYTDNNGAAKAKRGSLTLLR